MGEEAVASQGVPVLTLHQKARLGSASPTEPVFVRVRTGRSRYHVLVTPALRKRREGDSHDFKPRVSRSVFWTSYLARPCLKRNR